MSLIEICGNCITYRYHNNPSKHGCCSKIKGKTLSPLAETCGDYQPKRR